MERSNQALAARKARAMMRELPLHELRAARRLSQEALAAMLKTGRSSVSRLESRTDMYVSTLRRYIEALGGELEIIARFPDGTVRITQFGEIGS
jgi:transcriptional regulator with XRE-family HTH domain